MKNIFLKFLIIGGLGVLATSCSNLETNLQDNPSQITEQSTEPKYLLNRVQLGVGSLSNLINQRVGRVMRQRNMFSFYSSDFNSTQPEGWDTTWDTAYRTVLKTTQTLENHPLAKSGEIPYYLGEAQVLKAYTLIDLVDLWGNVPYSDALTDSINPRIDTGISIYKAAWELLSEAEVNFNKAQNTAAYPFLSEDIFYSGSTTKWKKLINSLRLKMLVQTKDAWTDLGWDGQTLFNGIIASNNYISAYTDDFDFKYSNISSPTDSRHPLYTANYISAPANFESNYMIYLMTSEKGLVDPRVRYYYYRQTSAAPTGTDLPCTTNPLITPNWRCYVGSSYRGRAHGDDTGVPADATRRTIPGLYPFGGAFDGNTFTNYTINKGAGGAGITPLMDASFVHFMISELYLKFNNTTASLNSLNTAVTQSIDKVMNFNSSFTVSAQVPTLTAVNDYKTKVTNLYNSASDVNNKLAVVIKEYFIASYGNGIEAYNAYRRTGFPAQMEPTVKEDVFPRTVLYPSNFANSNANAPAKPVTKQVFWDKNPADFIK